MKKNNVLVYAGAAAAVTACGFLLSKDARQFLFSSLSRGKTDLALLEPIFLKPAPDVEITNTPGPAICLFVADGKLTAQWQAQPDSGDSSSIQLEHSIEFSDGQPSLLVTCTKDAPAAAEIQRLYQLTSSYPLSRGALKQLERFLEERLSN